MSRTRPLLVGVELGGTKCVCTLGTGPGGVLDQQRISTTSPDETLGAVKVQLDAWSRQHGTPAALGIGSFGPIDLRPASERFGWIRATPKPGWRDVDVRGILAAGRDIPVGFDTDVNGAAHAEGLWGAAAGLADFAYVTLGTGIGVGLVVNGRTAHGYNHGELGHIRVARIPDDTWSGCCPYHEDCVEALASGPAIQARAGRPAESLPAEHPAWAFAAHAVGQLLHAIALSTAPQRIIVGGGIGTGQPRFLGQVRSCLLASINGFVDIEELAGPVEQYVVAPGLGAQAGPLGALALAAGAFGHAAGN